MTLSVRILAPGSADYNAAVALRRAVLRIPLGLDFSADDIAREAGDTHFAAWQGNRLVGTVVMTPYTDTRVKLRQMAVAEDMRGANIGAALLAAFEDHSRNTGIRDIVLAARVTARGFYARHGYTTDDAVFTEVTIPHIQMWKTL